MKSISLIGHLDIMMGLDTSVFNQSLKDASAALQETFGLNSKQANSVAKLEMALRKEAETFGMTATEAKLYALEQQGVSKEALASARALYRHIDALKADEKATEEAAKAAEEFRGKLKDFGKGFAAGLVGVGVAAVGAATAMTAFGVASLKSLKDTGAQASALGTTTKQLTTLQAIAQATGASFEDIQPALQTFNQQLGEAQAAGTGPTIDGLKMLGMSIEDISKLNPADAFKEISKGFQSLKTPAEQAAAANLLFGGDGLKLINTLKAGPEAFDRFGAAAEKLGQIMTDADAKMASDATQSLGQIWNTFTAVGTKIAVGFAPIITDLGTKFMDWATTSLDVGSIVNTSLEMVSKGLGYVADVIAGVQSAWYATQAALTKGAALYLDYIRLVGKGIEGLINLIPGMGVSFTGTLDEMSKGLHDLAGKQWQDAKDKFNNPPSAKISEYFDSIKTSADSAAMAINKTSEETLKAATSVKTLVTPFTTLRDSLKEKIDLFGLTSEQAEIAKFAKLDGVTSKQIEELKGLQTQLKGKEDFAKLKEDAKSLGESLKSPVEKYREELAKLGKLKDAGLITSDQFDKGRIEAGKGLGDQKNKLAGAMDFGSKEARSTILAYNMGGQQDGIKDVAKTSKDSLAVQKETLAFFKRVDSKVVATKQIDI